ncbi:unnamed protein product [Pleuronectes platessa]|uniref:Uncharacterized protein n=1 Tax=Pleuronectes platessa TaxID=8262 RepID=A0A9N7ZF83_PLEPL|nr:unnamed protein product [Pleuronectes platessa]
MAAMTAAGTTEGDQDGGHEGHRSRRETPSCSASGSVKMHRSPSPDGAKGGPASAHAFEGRIRERRSSLGDHTPWGKGYTWTRSKHHPSMTRTLLPSERWDLSRPHVGRRFSITQMTSGRKKHKIGTSTSIGRATQKRKAKRGRKKREST